MGGAASRSDNQRDIAKTATPVRKTTRTRYQTSENLDPSFHGGRRPPH
jgi:hypothetical protein